MEVDVTMTVEEEPVVSMTYVEGKLKPEIVGQVTPAYEPHRVTPPAGSVFSAVEVGAIPEPTEEETYTENGTYNVARIGRAIIQVPQGVFPDGTLPVMSNGYYDVTEFEGVNVAVNTDPEIGVVLADFTANGLPQTVRTVGMTVLPSWCFYTSNRYNRSMLLSQMKTLIINEGCTILKDSGARDIKTLERVILPATLRQIEHNVFLDDPAVEEYDFSACTVVPTLGSADSLGHAAGCVLKVPAGLLVEWQASANWNALTDVVWRAST